MARYSKVCPKSISCFSSDSRLYLDDSIVHLFQSYTNGFLDAFVSIGFELLAVDTDFVVAPYIFVSAILTDRIQAHC